MGLAERRRIAAIQAENAGYQAQMNEIAGYELPFTFDTTTLPEEEKVLASLEYYKDYAMPMMLRVFKEILRDDLGRTAVQNKIKSVRLINTSKNGDDPGEKNISLNEAGELLVAYGFYNYSDKLWGEEELRSAIERML